jgi:MSHA biogenesis protein MshE
MKKKRLGEILRERNQVSVENLDKAIQDQQGKLGHLGELLLRSGAVSKPDLVSALVEASRIPSFDCTSVEVDAETLRLITASMARRCCALPLQTAGNMLVVVMAEPRISVFWTSCVSSQACKSRQEWDFAVKSKQPSR